MRNVFEFLQENNGNLSTARLLPVVITSAIIFKYIYQVLSTGTASFTSEELVMVLGSFGIKVGQKAIENKANGNVATELPKS